MEYIQNYLSQIINYKNLIVASGIILTLAYYIRKFINGPKCIVNSNNLKEKIIIITGANAGIGLETAYLLLKKGATVIFACRDEKRTLAAIKKRITPFYQSKAVYINCDVSSFESIEIFCETFKKKFSHFDILINNAGAMFNTFKKLKNGMEISLATNHFGPMYLTMLLINNINPKGRIINVGSSLLKNYKFDKEELEKDILFEKTQRKYDFVKQYSLSKQMQFAFSKFLCSKGFKNKYSTINFKSVCLHPGVILTDAQSKFKGFFINLVLYLTLPLWFIFTKSIFYGAQTTLHCALEDYDKLESKKYYSDCDVTYLPLFLEDKYYNKEMLYYIYLLLEKYYNFEKMPKDARDIIELMREYSNK